MEIKLNYLNFFKERKILFVLINFFFFLIILNKNVNCELCRDMDIRNNPSNLKQLENCTFVQGYLQIILMDTARHNFDNYSFPKLREITGFLFVYRVFGLRSIGALFPNLIVIRGQVTKFSYGFLLYEVEQLQEIGLKSLIAIQHGFVRIQKNPSLCYVNTIDWDRITSPGGNLVEQSNENQCPTTESCRGCSPKNCWSMKNCQRSDNRVTYRLAMECHPQCLGGCYNHTSSGCFACRGPANNGVCVEECPENKILHLYSYRCVLISACIKANNIVYKKECIEECPKGFLLVDLVNEDDGTINQTCHRCKNNCEKSCSGTEISSLSDTEDLKGCIYIDGSLQIKLSDDVKDIMKALEENLGDIVEINGHLKIYRSMSITSLSFLRSLTLIHGSSLVDGKYALAIFENSNLQSLWDWKIKTSMKIIEGSMLFHYNTKLCMPEIEKLKEITTYSNKDDYICPESNGYKQSCNVLLMNSQALVLSPRNATILWEDVLPVNADSISGYLVYYIEAPTKDITIQDESDVCSQFSWRPIDVPSDSLLKESNLIALNITDLKPFTQYAYYVKTYNLRETSYDSKISQSEVRYFKTLPGPPNPPKVITLSKTSETIVIGISVIKHDEELIDHFTVEVLTQPDDATFLDERNFCEYPRVSEDEENRQTPDTMLASSLCCQQSENVYKDSRDEDEEDDKVIKLSTRHEKYMNCMEAHDSQQCESLRYNNRRKRDLTIGNYHSEISEHESWSTRLDDLGTALLKLATNSDGTQIKKKDSFFYSIDKKARDFTISNLKSFSLYTVLVVTCNKNKKCSPFFMHTDRTARLESADDILSFTITNLTSIYFVKFDPPKLPNGLTVAYNVEIINLQDVSSQKMLCVTRKRHEVNKNTVIIKDLIPASYGIRVRSVSLAGNGRWTEMQYIFVPSPPPDNTTRNLIITTIVIILLCGIGGYYGYRYFIKRNRIRRDETEDILLTNIVLPRPSSPSLGLPRPPSPSLSLPRPPSPERTIQMRSSPIRTLPTRSLQIRSVSPTPSSPSSTPPPAPIIPIVYLDNDRTIDINCEGAVGGIDI